MSLISVFAPAVVKHWSALAVMATALLTLPPDHVSTPEWQAKEEFEAQMIFDSIDPTRFIVVEASEAAAEARWRAECALVDALPLEEVLRRFEEMHALQDHASSLIYTDCVPLYRRDPLGQRLFAIAERGAPEERATLRAHVEHFLREVFPSYSAELTSTNGFHSIESKEIYPVLLAEMDADGESLGCLVAAAASKHRTGVNTLVDQFFATAIIEVAGHLRDRQAKDDSSENAQAAALREFFQFLNTLQAEREYEVLDYDETRFPPLAKTKYMSPDNTMYHYDELLDLAQKVVAARN